MADERVLAKVDELISLCEQCKRIYRSDDEYFRNPEYVRRRDEIIQALPGVRQIAERFYPRVLSDFVEHNQMYTFPWDIVLSQSVELRGAISSAAEMEEILGPVGPRLSASNLHPWVWNAAVDLWDGGHHRAAVHDAYTKVETMTQMKASRTENGRALWGEVFSTKPPAGGRSRLRFPGLAEGTDRHTSAHEGAVHFGMGCAQAMRNWAAHTLDEADDQLALEYLAALSVLARWVDQCETI